MSDHDADAIRAIEMLVEHFGPWETVRRIISCADSCPLPFDRIEALRLVEIQCGNHNATVDDE